MNYILNGIRNPIWIFCNRPRIRWRFRSWILKQQVKSGSNVRLREFCRIINGQRDRAAITLGNNVVVDGELLVLPNHGKIIIGSDVFIGERCRVWSGSLISIGNRVLVSYGVSILDSPFHELSAQSRHQQFRDAFVAKTNVELINEAVRMRSKPIRIDDDAWIGFGASILRGVHIGKGAVIAAGTIVTKDVKPYTVVAGSPSRVIGKSCQ